MEHHWEKIDSGKIVVSSTAQGLWRNAVEYFKWSDGNPIKTQKTLTSGKEAGKVVVTSTIRPYSIKALCMHCGITEEWLRDIRQGNDVRSEYYHAVSRIMYVIYTQNMEMALIGEYNPIFTARVLNLDKDDVPTSAITVNIVGGLPALSRSENEILEKLEKENRRIREAGSENF